MARYDRLRESRQSSERQRLQALLAEQRRRRLAFIFAVMTGLIALLGYRLFYWHILEADTLKARVRLPAETAEDVRPRGTIRDRNGYMLAVDGVSYDLAVSPNIIGNPEKMASAVAPIIGSDHSELRRIFEGNERYIPITTSLPYTVGQQLIELDSRALRITKHLIRDYPNGPLAAHILGFVNAERRGHYGVEAYYNDLLSSPGTPPESDEPIAEEIKIGHRPFAPTREGVDLILTIDRAVQVIVEQELRAAIAGFGAQGGTIIVLDPKSGDILAMASEPSYNPNDYARTPPERFANPALEQQYEPGSVFKIITAAAALDSGVADSQTVFQDTGVIEVGGQYIRNWDGGSYGSQTVTGILGYSLNTGVAWLATRVGAERMLSYYHAFGFGSPTGVDLGGEVAGQVKKPGDGLWHPSDLGTNAFGQGISVTPIQMASAIAAVVNHGTLMQPRIVKAVVDNGQVREMPTITRGQPIQPAVADRLREILADAVEMETKTALLGEWRIGGKTGTAQIPIPGGYHATDTIASFVGFAPADDPAFVMLVTLDRPPGEMRWGSQSAAPTFQKLARRLLNYWNIPPDRFRLAQRPPDRPAAPEPPSVELNATPTP